MTFFKSFNVKVYWSWILFTDRLTEIKMKTLSTIMNTFKTDERYKACFYFVFWLIKYTEICFILLQWLNRYEWKRNGVVVPNSQFIAIDRAIGTLKLVKMQNQDYGTYQCFAKNNFGTSLSKPFKVKESSKFK